MTYIVLKLFCRKLFPPGYYVQVILDELFQGGAKILTKEFHWERVYFPLQNHYAKTEYII